MGLIPKLLCCFNPKTVTEPVSTDSNGADSGAVPSGHAPKNQKFTAKGGEAPSKVLDSKTIDPAVLKNIQATDLSKLDPVNIGSSRPKFVYFFDAEGDSTECKADAAFMVDTGMPIDEQQSYEKLKNKLEKTSGVNVPEVYGKLDQHPIVQWVPETTTFSAKTSLVSAFKSLEKLALLNASQPLYKDPLQIDVLEKFSGNLQKLIDLKYNSGDLQFMMDNTTGDIYIMDLEGNNQPKFGKTNPQLSALKEAVDKKIESLKQEQLSVKE